MRQKEITHFLQACLEVEKRVDGKGEGEVKEGKGGEQEDRGVSRQ